MRFGVTIPNNWGIADPRQASGGPVYAIRGIDAPRGGS